MGPIKVAKRQHSAHRSAPPTGDAVRSNRSKCFDELLTALHTAYKSKRHEDVRAIAVELFQLDTRAALQEQVLVPVWKALHKSIQCAQEAHEGDPTSGNRDVVHDLCIAAHRVLDQMYQRLCNLGNRKSGRRVLQKLYMYMGDVHRYEARAATTAGESQQKPLHHALQRYHAAWRMHPGVGHASNQVALVHQSRSEWLLSLYFYLRALFSDDDGFTKAAHNIESIFAIHAPRGTTSLDAFEFDAVTLVATFWQVARRPSELCAATLYRNTNRVLSSLRTYVSDGAMFDSTVALPLRLMLCLILCCNGSSVPSVLVDSIRRVQDFMFELRTAEVSNVQHRTMSFDAVQSLSAASEVSARWLAVHIRNSTWAEQHGSCDFSKRPPQDLCASKLHEDRELEGLLLLWDNGQQNYLSSSEAIEFYGCLEDTIVTSEAAAQIRSGRLLYLATIAVLGQTFNDEDSDEDDMVVFAEHTELA